MASIDDLKELASRGKRLGKAIRASRWRYAIWPDGEEFYDLKKDPQEETNLAKARDYTDRLTEMRALLQRAEAKAVSKK